MISEAPRSGALRRERLALFIAALAGALAAWTALDNSEMLLAVGIADSAVLLAMFLANALLCLWLLLVSRGSYRREALIVLVVNGACLIARLAVGLFGADADSALSESLPPQHGWMPILFVVAFAFLSARTAMLASLVAYALMAALVLAFLLLNPEQFSDSLAGRALARQYLLGHLAYIALLWLVVRRAEDPA